jgi:hypothetical protein
MTEKKSPPFRIAPLQRIAADPITDPAERAALDEQRKRPAQTWSAAGVDADLPSDAQDTAAEGLPPAQQPTAAPVTEVLQRIEQFPAQQQLLLLMKLTGQLPADGRRALAEQLMGQLPADVLKLLEERLRARLNGE